MGCIWNIVRRGMQGGRKNSDAGTLPDANSDETFSWPESGENFIRQNLVQIGPNRYVLLEPGLTLPQSAH